MWNTFTGLPATKSGKWSVVLTITFAVLFLINSFVIIPASTDGSWEQIMLSFDGITMVLCGLAAGLTGLIAMIYHHERSWLAWISIWPGLIVIFLLVNAFLFPD